MNRSAAAEGSGTNPSGAHTTLAENEAAAGMATSWAALRPNRVEEATPGGGIGKAKARAYELGHCVNVMLH